MEAKLEICGTRQFTCFLNVFFHVVQTTEQEHISFVSTFEMKAILQQKGSRYMERTLPANEKHLRDVVLALLGTDVLGVCSQLESMQALWSLESCQLRLALENRGMYLARHAQRALPHASQPLQLGLRINAVADIQPGK